LRRGDFKPQCLATAVGSMPQINPQLAVRTVLRHLPEIPVWPQLPHRGFSESMYVQFTERFPGVVLEDERIYVDRNANVDDALAQLYVAYLENNIEYGRVSPEFASGLYALLSAEVPARVAVKGQVIGPISWGLTVTDQDRRPVLYDDVLADALAKHLRLKAAWQESQLARISPDTILFVDEPYMSSFGSAFVSVSREQVVSLLDEVFAGINGLRGVHCCGNTDWSVLLATNADILSFDAYSYAETIALYPAELGAFLGSGGVLAWGIVPNTAEALAHEDAASLQARLEAAMAALERKGISREVLIDQCLITPCCGLQGLKPETATQALALTRELSLRLREAYVKER
jgi:hypothetical protein